jgi:hypothetical protein
MLLALALVGFGLGLVVGIAGGTVERNGIATVLAVLVLIPATVELILAWHPDRSRRAL